MMHGAGSCTVPAADVPRRGRVTADFGSEVLHDTAAGREHAEPSATDTGEGSESRWLWSVQLSGDMGRSSHCEFVALTRVVLSELELLGLAGAPRVASEFSGKVWLFATHYPCLSCLGVLAQFRWRFPNIQLALEYSEWRDWQNEMQQALADA